MFFWIAIVAVFLVGMTAAGIAFLNGDGEDAAFAGFISAFITAFVCFFVIIFGSASTSTDQHFDVVKSEKTYTIAENSTASLEKTNLRFAYVEDGQIKTFSETVRPFDVPMEKPKQIKVMHYDSVNSGLVPWPVDDGYKVEVIR
jgi:hypothetical protein